MSTQGQRYGLIGFACDFGGTVSGSKDGPGRLRDRGILSVFSNLGHEVADYGDVTPSNAHIPQTSFTQEERNSKNSREVYSSCAELYSRTTQVLQDSRIPFILGGDHSLSIGSVAAVADHYAINGKKIGLLWVDAHPDINTPETSPSGRFYGMSVAILAGLVPGALASLQKSGLAVRFENLAFIGLRDVDPGERLLLKQRCPAALTMSLIDELQIRAAVDQALEAVTNGTDGFVLSFDLDACDPHFAPGTGTPKRGGLTYRECHYILERAAATQKLASIEVVEFNPGLDRNGETAEVTLSLAESILGRTIL